ncbi:MAG: heavy-metal-associated domain-containing protein [Campylobacterales bacterium]|nr:heavy-metal-associated domain-containing protein [Campylobacterales bacterium]
MQQTFEVFNVKCGGCANTLIKNLAEEFGEVSVDLESEPRKITLNIQENQIEKLKLILRGLGYPLATDELNTLQTFTTSAKSFVSCAIGKMDI